MSLKSCEKVETNLYALEVAADAESFKAAVTKAYAKNKGKFNVPGFRKGKAPKHVIETYYGKDAFWYDAVDMIFPEHYEAAVKEAGINPVAAPFDEELSEVTEEGFSVTLKVYVKPEVEVKKYKGLEAEKAEVTVTEEEVKDHIQKELEKSAKLVSVDDRAVENGDTANIDFEGFADGVAFDGGKGEDYDLEIGSGTFIPGFEDQIIGHNIGDEFDVNVTFPEDYGAEDLAGKAVVFKVKLNRISFKQLPEYNDEFVKDETEDCDTIADYEKHIEEEIKAHKESHAKNDYEAAVVDALLAETECEIPDVMIEKEIDNEVEQFAYRLQMQGLDLKTYLSYLGTDEQAMRDSYRDNAAKQVKLRLVLEKIFELENFEISDEDIDNELKKYSEAYNIEIEKIRTMVPVDEIKADLGCRKAMDLVLENAVAVPAAEEAHEDAE